MIDSFDVYSMQFFKGYNLIFTASLRSLGQQFAGSCIIEKGMTSTIISTFAVFLIPRKTSNEVLT